MMKKIHNIHFDSSFERQAIEYLVKEDLKSKYNNTLKVKYNLSPKKVKIFNLVKKVGKLAAVLLGIVTAIHLFSNPFSPKAEKMAMNFAKDTNLLGNQDVMRKDHRYINEIRLAANTSFVKAKYEEAIASYAKLIQLNSSNDIDHFYLAICYLKTKEPDAGKALNEFSQIEQNISMIHELRWFKSLALIINREYESAEKLLVEIIEAGVYKKSEARKLLAALCKKTHNTKA